MLLLIALIIIKSISIEPWCPRIQRRISFESSRSASISIWVRVEPTKLPSSSEEKNCCKTIRLKPCNTVVLSTWGVQIENVAGTIA